MFMLLAKKEFSCLYFAKHLASHDPNNEESCLILAGHYLRHKKFKKCKEVLQEYLSKERDASDRCRLALTQLHLIQGDRQAAISELHSVLSLSNSPAFLATLVSLCRAEGKLEEAIAPLTAAVEHWASRGDAIYPMLQNRLAELLLDVGKPSEAIAIYEDMLKTKQHDLTLKAKLSIAQAAIDPKLGKETLSTIPTPQDLHNLDPQDLLEEMITTPDPKVCSDIDLNLNLIQEKITARKKEKRKRRPPRIPKGVTDPDPNFVPDPDRWLPKRKKRKRWQKNTSAQGGETKRTNTLNIENVEKKGRRKR